MNKQLEFEVLLNFCTDSHSYFSSSILFLIDFKQPGAGARQEQMAP